MASMAGGLQGIPAASNESGKTPTKDLLVLGVILHHPKKFTLFMLVWQMLHLGRWCFPKSSGVFAVAEVP